MIIFYLKMKSSCEVSFFYLIKNPIKYEATRLPVIIPQVPDPERVLRSSYDDS